MACNFAVKDLNDLGHKLRDDLQRHKEAAVRATQYHNSVSCDFASKIWIILVTNSETICKDMKEAAVSAPHNYVTMTCDFEVKDLGDLGHKLRDDLRSDFSCMPQP
jgi:hypothetical protein